MGFNITRILKGLLLREAGVLSPKEIEITPAGTAGTKTSIVSSQTANITMTIPDATDTFVGKATVDTFTNKTLTGNIAVNLVSGAATVTLPVATSSLATLALAETLTNKTLTTPIISSPTGLVKADVGLGNVDNTSDVNKPVSTAQAVADALNLKIASNLSDLASAPTARTNIGLGNVDNTSDATKNAAVATLTNKTLTSPAITTPTGIVKGDVGLGNVDNTSDATKNAAAVTLTNKTITSPIISTISNTGTLTLPTSTDTLVGKATTDALTNKDFQGGTASNTSRITVPSATKATLDALTRKEATIVYGTDTDKLYADDGTNLVAIGSSAGAVNFVTNPDAETGTTGWTVNSFAAATRPAGALTGTTTGITLAASSSTPLAGTNSFTIAKDAANRQGRVVYTDITLTPAYFAKVLTIGIDYIVSAGTFVAGSSGVDSDVIPYIQNVTDGTFIEPSSFKFLSNSSTIADHFSATFQTAAAATSYRLLLYFPTTSAASFTLKLDNIAVSPSAYVYGTPITDWKAATFTGTWTGVTYTGFERRVGDSKQFRVGITMSGAPSGGGQFYLNLPSGNTIDTNKLANTGVTTSNIFGTGKTFNGGSNVTNITVSYGSTTTVSLAYESTAAGQLAGLTTTAPFTYASGMTVHADFEVPIVGLSSSVQMSQDAGGRPVSFSGGSAVATSIPSATWTRVPFVAEKDSHGAWNGSTFTVPEAGDYDVKATIAYSVDTFTIGGYIIIAIYKNGALYKNATDYVQWTGSQIPSAHKVSHEMPCVAGDTIEIYTIHSNGTALTLYGNSSEKFVSISKKSASSAIAATELISAVYGAGGGVTLGTGVAIVQYDTIEIDTHGAVTTGAAWKFTAPAAGKYMITGTSRVTTAGRRLDLYKNGSKIKILNEFAVDVTGSFFAEVQLIASDYIDVRSAAGSSASVYGDVMYNSINITRIGL